MDRFRSAMKTIVAVSKARVIGTGKGAPQEAPAGRKEALISRVRRSVPRFVVLVGSDDDPGGWLGPHMPAGTAIEPPDRSNRLATLEALAAAAPTKPLWGRQACGSRS
jgi:hypothetical protein